MYGGATAQYPLYGTGPGGLVTGAAAAAAFYPYLQMGEAGNGGAGGGYTTTSSQGYGVQYPHHLFPYSPINSTGAFPQNYGPPISLAPSPALPSGNF